MIVLFLLFLSSSLLILYAGYRIMIIIFIVFSLQEMTNFGGESGLQHQIFISLQPSYNNKKFICYSVRSEIFTL